MFSDRISLRTITTTQNANGYPVESYVDVVVWANKKSVTRSEFYAANSQGILISAVFEVHSEDYTNQTQIVDGTKVYSIERAYQKGLGVYELVCSDKAV